MRAADCEIATPVEPPREGARHRQLVPALDVAVDERHRDRLHSRVAELRGERVEVEAVERPDHRPVRREPFGDLEPQVARNEGRGPLPLGIEQPAHEPAALADFQDVSKPLRGDESGAGALAFEEGVGGDGRAVHERDDRPRGNPERGQRIEHAAPLLAGERRNLRRMEHAIRSVGDEVGERAADVHPDAESGLKFLQFFII